MMLAAAPGALDFRAVLDWATESYVPRPLLEQEVRQRLQRTDCPCQLIVGELGCGKTSLASHFIQREGYLHHFLRVGHTESSLWGDPYAFLTSLGFQLKAAFGSGLFPEVMAMSVRGSVHNVGKTGRVVGIDVERYVTVPWRREELNLHVDLEARWVEGKAIGIRIGELVEEYRHIPLLTFRQMAWFEPLRRLRELAPGQRVVVWIDGLDEDTSLPGPGQGCFEQRIVDILPLGSELAELGNALLVVTSRRGPHLDRFLRDGAPVLEMDAPEYRGDTAQAIAEFVEQGLASADVVRELESLDWPPATLRRELHERSEQNFLYVRQFFESLRAGHGALLRAGGLPSGLGSIYERILGGLARRQGDRYGEFFQPVLEVLAVAYDALGGQQLVRLTGLSPNRVAEVIAELKPFLDTHEHEQESLYTFHHKSLRDFLTCEETREEVWHVDPARAHARVAERCFSGGEVGLDDYGLRFGTSHLAQGGWPEQLQLMRLIGSRWRKTCREHFGSNRAFLRDLEAAAGCARKLPFAEAIREICRFGLMGALVENAERQNSPLALEVMLKLHQTERALEYMPVRARGTAGSTWRASVLRGLASIGAPGQKLFEQLLQEGIEQVSRDLDTLAVNSSRLLEACAPTHAPFMADILERVARSLLRAPIPMDAPPPAGIYVEGARLWSTIDPKMADLWFRGALALIYDHGSGLHPFSYWILGVLLRYWSEIDPAAAAEAMQTRQVPLDPYVISGLLAVGAAQGKDRLVWHLLQVLHWLNAAPTSVEELKETNYIRRGRYRIAIIAARHLNLLGFHETASRLVERTLERVTQARARFGRENTEELDILLETAEIDYQIDPARAQRTLEQVWEVLAMHREPPYDFVDLEDSDDFRAGLPTLVRLQLETDADLLEPYVESLTDRELKSKVSVEAARQLAVSAPGRARDYLEAALSLSERPTISFWCWGTLMLELVHAGGLDDRRRNAAFLKQRGLDKDSLVCWRLGILGELNARVPSQAWEWLTETLQLWDSQDIDFVQNLPAALPNWPEQIVRRLPDVLDSVRGPVQRRFLQAALARCLHSIDPARSAQWLDSAATSPEGIGSAPLFEPVQLAFVAGQAWNIDALRASEIWKRAVALLDKTWPSGSMPHQNCQINMLENLRQGSPRASLSELVRFATSPEGNGWEEWKRTVVVAGVGVSEYRLAGLFGGQFPLALTLLELSSRSEEELSVPFIESLPPAVQSLFWSRFAPIAGGYPLPRKLVWCRKAVEQAWLIPLHGLRCLLLADAAVAYLQLGAKQRARELALSVEREILTSERFVGSSLLELQPLAGYAYALGRVLRVSIACRETQRALATLWNSRVLGPDGFLLVVASLPATLREHHRIDFDSWVSVVDEAIHVYADVDSTVAAWTGLSSSSPGSAPA
ncbi:hypothetical protein [Archangium lipolyticum]|uniref:hypothetical protein n=1 Tax=Archangium lipolyticum TaxID=2970465 RepID=UPI002149B30C|nr:hypothetical protein [Archangium lipolyticum]